MLSDDEARRLIDDCVTRESRLTEWEQGFISSLDRQVDMGVFLTEKQVSLLEFLWAKATAGG